MSCWSNGLERPCSTISGIHSYCVQSTVEKHVNQGNRLRWWLSGIFYALILGLLFATSCAINPSPTLSVILGALIGFFAFPVTYHMVHGTMSIQGDLAFLLTMLAYAATALAGAAFICMRLIGVTIASCELGVSGGCFILMLPGLVIASVMWMYFRLKQLWSGSNT